jgi:tRNA dimethylallyltransferase
LEEKGGNEFSIFDFWFAILFLKFCVSVVSMVSNPQSSISSHSRRVLVVVGPTASGKTLLSQLLAQELNAEIISADSRQIYKYMDIGTAKPSLEERKKVKHYFIDELTPDEEFNAGEFGKRGREILDDIFRRRKVPLVVGGSGLYIQSLIDGFFEGPSRDNRVRHELYERLHREGVEVLLEELRTVDPESASNMLPSNTRRIIRALEVYKLTGIPISQWKKQKIEINFVPLVVGLQWERAVLYERINRRVDWMIQQGLVDEVKNLRERGYDSNLNALQTVGYKEVFEYLDGKISFEQMIEHIKQNSRRYAKRQLTWFRADKRIHWFKLEKEEQVVALARQMWKLVSQKSGRLDLNQRPLGPEPSALAGLSHAPLNSEENNKISEDNQTEKRIFTESK